MTRNQTTRIWQSAAQLLVGFAALSLLTWVGFGLGLNLTTTAFAYLILIVLLSLLGSVIPLVALSIVAVVCLNYFFNEPLFTLRVDYPEDVLELAAFLISVLVVTGLVRRARRLTATARASQNEIQALKDELRLVIDTIPAVVWSKLPDGSADFLNQRFRDLTGLTLQDGLGWGWMTAFHPEDRAMDEWRAALAAGEPFEKEARLRRADGEYRWFALRAVPLRDEQGNIVKWYGASTDIEDRKRAEEVLREQAGLLDLTHDTVFARDMNDVITYWNRGAEERYGWKSEQARGHVTHDLLQTRFPEPLEDIAEKLRRTGRWEGELVHTKRDGTQVIVASRWALQRDEQGNPNAVLETNNDITQRKQAQEALRDSEQRYRNIFDTAGVSIWEEDFSEVKAAIDDLTAQGVRDFRQHLAAHPEFVQHAIAMVKIVDVNDMAVKLFAAESKDELLGSLHKVFVPETQGAFVGELIALAEGRTFFEAETVLQTLQGERLTTLFTITFPTPPARFDSVLVTVTDISERKRAEEALRQQANLLEQTHDAIIVREFQGTIIYWNQGARQLYGFRKDEAIGRITHDLLRTEHPMPTDAFEATIERQQSWTGELTHTTRDGRKVIVDSRQVLVEVGDGRRLVLETNRDISERKRAEYLATQVFEISPDGVAIIGTDYRFQRVNPVYEQHFGMPRERIVGLHVADLRGMDVFEQEVKPSLDRCFEGEEVSHAGWFTGRLGRRYLGTTCSPLRPHSERVEAALVISRDLTDHVNAAEALRETQMELAHVTRVTTLGEVTASFAHELNQPLAAIVNNANACLGLLPSRRRDLDEVRDALADIVSDADRASAIIERVRGLAKRSSPEQVPLQLGGVVDDVVALAAAESVARRVAIRTDVAADLPDVMGDRVQLQQVLLNLVVNGMDAMSTVPERERLLEIRGRPDRHDGNPAARISVQDRGVGFDAGQIERLFEPFYTTKAEGMGMGLAISRSIIEAHRGRLWAESNLGPGATFSFSVPATAASVVRAESGE